MLAQVYHAAKKNKILSRVTLFQNGVDMVRRKVVMNPGTYSIRNKILAILSPFSGA